MEGAQVLSRRSCCYATVGGDQLPSRSEACRPRNWSLDFEFPSWIAYFPLFHFKTTLSGTRSLRSWQSGLETATPSVPQSTKLVKHGRVFYNNNGVRVKMLTTTPKLSLLFPPFPLSVLALLLLACPAARKLRVTGCALTMTRD